MDPVITVRGDGGCLGVATSIPLSRRRWDLGQGFGAASCFRHPGSFRSRAQAGDAAGFRTYAWVLSRNARPRSSTRACWGQVLARRRQPAPDCPSLDVEEIPMPQSQVRSMALVLMLFGFVGGVLHRTKLRPALHDRGCYADGLTIGLDGDTPKSLPQTEPVVMLDQSLTERQWDRLRDWCT